MPTSSSSASNPSKVDRDIASCIRKLETETKLEKRRDYLTKIRVLLHEQMQDKKKTATLVHQALASTVVECLRQDPQDEKMVEESSCILYFVSKINPQYKKSVARLFRAMDDHKDNLAIQRASGGAIRNVVAANPDSLPRIAPSIKILLQSMVRHATDVKFVAMALEILSHLASHPPSKQYFVSCGALGHVLVAMQRHPTQPVVQATAFKSLANLSQDASPTLQQEMIPCLALCLQGMKNHASLHPKVASYGCLTLSHLALQTFTPETLHGDAVETLLLVMKHHPTLEKVQAPSCAALEHYLQHCPLEQLESSTVGGIPIILHAMSQFPQSLNIQKDALSTLVMLTNRLPDHHELILSEGGLDIIIATMKECEHDIDLSQMGCEFLKNFTRQSLDLQRAVSAKGGIQVVLTAMRRHVQIIDVQDRAFACMRNLCTHRDNRVQVREHGGISTMLVTMSVFAQDPIIQAYACDAMGRLALEEENREDIEQEKGVDVALAAMQHHPTHVGVQDRAIFMMLALSEYEPAVLSMKEKGVMDVLKQARIPNKQEALDRLKQLATRIEQAGGSGSGKSNSNWLW